MTLYQVSYQLLVSAIFITCRYLQIYSYQLLLPTLIRYSFQLLITGGRFYSFLYISCSLLHQLLLSTYLFSYQFEVLLSVNNITCSQQLLVSAIPSGISVSYSYLLFSLTPIRCSCQKSFVTNHHLLLVSHTPIRYTYATSEQRNNEIHSQLKVTTFPSLRKRKQFLHSKI